MEDRGLRSTEGRKVGFRVEGVVFDTSALLLMFLEGIRVLDEVLDIIEAPYIPIIPLPVLRELRRLASRSGRIGIAAKSALSLTRGKFAIARARGSPDNSVVELARTYGYAVITCDLEIMRRCRSLGIRVIYLRRGSMRMWDSFK